MKKILVAGVVAILGVFAYYSLSSGWTKTIVRTQKQSPNQLSPTISPTSIKSQDLFVPYWTLASLQKDSYQSYVYFGITPNEDGIDTNEPGYAHISQAVDSIPRGINTLLVVRMIDTTISSKVLNDTELRQRVINDAISIAKAHGFDGIVLDLEYSALAFDSVTTSITTFVQQFSEAAHKDKLAFAMTVYGDTFYRGRPYDVATLAHAVDSFYVLAYDLHKANGDAGPNFPLTDDDYDMQKMVQDFETKVDPQKLIVTFGMFGYDWTVDDKGRSTKAASSLSTSDMEKKFVVRCQMSKCALRRDSASGEMTVSYVDASGNSHSVWFEDEASVEQKKKLLEKMGISHIAYWANGYW